MFRGKIFVSILLGIAFLAGILSPVPECYVTRVICPLKKSVADQNHASQPFPASHSSPCCFSKESSSVSSSKCPLIALRPWMKSYSPDLETIDIPVLHVSLIPRIFDEFRWKSNETFAVVRETRHAIPPPIPILLQKESFLI